MGASTFSWLDHSERERRRVLDAIDQFKEPTTRDELGLGTIRDAFADHFFPGTSTLQTRARYFLFVPWMYRSLEGHGPVTDPETKARRLELALVDVLLDAGEIAGTIGRVARKSLKRLPSSIYWLGLDAWGIREFRGAQDDYHHLLAQTGGAYIPRDDDGEPLADGAVRTWTSALPPPPSSFPKQASFTLTRREAAFLVDQIRRNAPKTMLEFLAGRGVRAECDYPWQHPQLSEFHPELQNELGHGRNFAEAMHGAVLLYNLMLHEAQPGADHDERVAAAHTTIADWTKELRPRQAELATWDRRAFWAMVAQWIHVRAATKHFVESWLELVPWTLDLATSDAARKLVQAREQQLKGKRARIGNPSALELWGGASGGGRIDYRWNAARRLLQDIYEGVKRGDDAGAT